MGVWLSIKEGGGGGGSALGGILPPRSSVKGFGEGAGVFSEFFVVMLTF